MLNVLIKNKIFLKKNWVETNGFRLCKKGHVPEWMPRNAKFYKFIYDLLNRENTTKVIKFVEELMECGTVTRVAIRDKIRENKLHNSKVQPDRAGQAKDIAKLKYVPSQASRVETVIKRWEQWSDLKRTDEDLPNLIQVLMDVSHNRYKEALVHVEGVILKYSQVGSDVEARLKADLNIDWEEN